MHRALESWLSNQPPETTRRRAIGIAAVAVVHALGFILLLSLAPPFLKKVQPEVRNFELLPVKEPKSPPKAEPVPRVISKSPVAPPPPEAQPTPQTPLNMILMDSPTFAASDIARLPSYAKSPPPAASVADSDGVVGKGPDGAPLYEGKLLAAPSFAQLAFYRPKEERNKPASGTIICKWLPDNTLKDCQEEGETPRGSGMARALRQSAWLFRARPYYLGKRQIFGWLRITYELSENPDK